ncbi:hypothetical protein ACMHYJ_05360 [Castellaniella hirudinis]|uniref:hypothetical protein n=1 Tax=Castellaniella hirudinis TaxID=1144617 RepID=UPI0039C0726F
MTYADHPDAIWDEIEEPMIQVAPGVRRHIATVESHGAGDVPCRCWRCCGGVLAHERAVLDRALARHLLRMAWQEREDWLGRWALSSKHTQTDVAVLRRWIAIEEGQRLPQPIYPWGQQ